MDLMGSRGIKQLKESKPYKRINRQESGEKWAELKWRKVGRVKVESTLIYIRHGIILKKIINKKLFGE